MIVRALTHQRNLNNNNKKQGDTKCFTTFFSHSSFLLHSFAIKFTRPTAPVSTNKAIKIKCQANKSQEN